MIKNQTFFVSLFTRRIIATGNNDNSDGGHHRLKTAL
jgi:hypothetical protein